MRKPFHWTDEKIDLLKKYWAEGKPASEIQDLIGHHSRSAITGKVHYLNLPKRSDSTFRNTASIRRKKEKKRAEAEGRAPRPSFNVVPYDRGPMKNPQPGIKVDRFQTDDDVARKTLLELEPNDCRYPVGVPKKPGFGFCALPKVPMSSYCACHTARCSRGLYGAPPTNASAVAEKLVPVPETA